MFVHSCVCIRVHVICFPGLNYLSVGGTMLQAWLSGEGGMHAILPPLGLLAGKPALSTGRVHAFDDQVWGCRLP